MNIAVNLSEEEDSLKLQESTLVQPLVSQCVFLKQLEIQIIYEPHTLEGVPKGLSSRKVILVHPCSFLLISQYPGNRNNRDTII